MLNYINEITNGGFKPGSVSIFYGKKGSGKTSIQVALANALLEDKKRILFLTSDIKVSSIRFISPELTVTVKDRGVELWNSNDLDSFLKERVYDLVIVDDVYDCFVADEFVLKCAAVKYNIPIVATIGSTRDDLSLDVVIDTIIRNKNDNVMVGMADLIVYQEMKDGEVLLKPIKNRWDSFAEHVYTLAELEH